ncbi:HNH endonuclease [Paenibacillus sp. MBLB4367]|uniref:HNH endonuclease n=1 Tax=Paenibacillus sp. MBLB4367 TaxID=3384767 RepID=UPI003907F3BF
MTKRIDITGQKFGDLEVIKISEKKDKNHSILWMCKCVCEKIIYVRGSDLRRGIYKSCGCKRAEKRNRGVALHIENDRTDRTRKSALKAKAHKDNTSGYKGVCWLESRHKWRAHIGFKGKSINLGLFETSSH